MEKLLLITVLLILPVFFYFLFRRKLGAKALKEKVDNGSSATHERRSEDSMSEHVINGKRFDPKRHYGFTFKEGQPKTTADKFQDLITKASQEYLID